MVLKGVSKPENIEEFETLGGNFSITLSKDPTADYYFGDGRYNKSDYQVDCHTITFSGNSYPLYKIQPPKI